MISAQVLSLMTALIQAPVPSYGGDIVIYERASGESILPGLTDTTGTKLINEAVFESLFTIDKNGKLVGQLAQDGFSYRDGVLKFKLRSHILLHNGETLQPRHIIDHFSRLTDRKYRAKHIVAPFTNLESSPNNQKVNISFSPQSSEFQIRTQPPYPDIARLLASPRAAVSVGNFGTGPFRLERDEPITAVSFLQHRRGAPYVDKLFYRPGISPFKARAALRSGEADIVFGVDKLDRKTENFGSRYESKRYEKFIVLQVGTRSRDLINASDLNNLRSAFNRKQLARRYLSGNAAPATNFFAHNQTLPRARKFERSRRERSMIVNKDSLASIRFAERIQFELVKRGLIVKVESLAGSDFKQRIADEEFDFALRSLTLNQTSPDSIASKLHRLLEVASDHQVFDEISDAKRMSDFAFASRKEQSSLLAKLERDLREAARFIVIAKQVPVSFWRKTLSNHDNGPTQLENLEKR